MMIKLNRFLLPTITYITLGFSSMVFAKVDRSIIAAPSLQNSLLENSLTQKIEVHLPPAYEASNAKFPVIYYLHGYGRTQSESEKLAGLNYRERVKAGKLQAMIVVGINGQTSFGGSFYANSPVSGNWEDFVAKDVVAYIDNNYRTINKASHRGLAGFSMGGTGTINIGLHRPDVFKHIFALSPGAFDLNGLRDAKAMWKAKPSQQFLDSYAAAFAPNVNGIDGEYWHKLSLDSDNSNEVIQKWESGFAALEQKIKRYKAKSARLDSIYVEYGNQDYFQWIVTGSQYLINILEAHKLPVQSLDHKGKHVIDESLGIHIMTFFDGAFSE